MDTIARQSKQFGLRVLLILAFAGLCSSGSGQVKSQAPSMPAQPPFPCCLITSIEASTGVVTAKVNATGQAFQFKVTDATLLRSLKIGQGVYANLKTHQVSVDGKTPCCQIISVGRGAPQSAQSGPASTSSSHPPTAAPPRAQSSSGANSACCAITSIKAPEQLVTAKVNTSGQTFEFKVTNQAVLQSLKVGQVVYANFKTQQVSLDGVNPCCQIVNLGVGQPGSTPPIAGTPAPGQRPAGQVFRGGPCCSVTSVGAAAGVATAKINFSSQTFQFKAANQPSLPALKLGQGVYANLQTAQVSVDGVQWCCQILAVGPRTPRVTPIFRPGPAIRVGSAVLGPRPAGIGPTITAQLRPHGPGQVSPFMQASGGSGVDAANGLISAPWPGFSQAFVHKGLKPLADSFSKGITIASGSGSIGVDVSCCDGLNLGSTQVGADWHYNLTLKGVPYVDLTSGAPGFRYASLTGDGGNPPGFIARAPLNGAWNFGAIVSLVLDAGIDDHVGQRLDWSVPTMSMAFGVLNFSVTAAAQLDSSQPDRPTLVKADLSPDLILFIAMEGVFPPVPSTIIPIPIALTLEAQPGSVALKGHFATNAIPGLALNTRATGDITLTFTPNSNTGALTATLSLTGYLEFDLINPINNQNLATQRLDLASLSIPFEVGGDLQKLIASAVAPVPTWPPAGGSITSVGYGGLGRTASASGKKGNGVSHDLELEGVTPPPPNPPPDFAGVAQQLETAMPRHIPYGAILMLDKTDRTSVQSPGVPYQLRSTQIKRGVLSNSAPFTYGRLADSAIWTGHYLAAESFRYAATNDPAALARIQELLKGIQLLFSITNDAVGQNCANGTDVRTCEFKPIPPEVAGKILSRSVLPSNSKFPYTLDHTLQGYPPAMKRSDGTTPCFYIHPEGGWVVGNKTYQNLAAATVPQAATQGSGAGGSQYPQAVLRPRAVSRPQTKVSPNQVNATGQLQQAQLSLKPVPTGTLWYGVGCGKDGDDDVVSRDAYVGTMMGLAFAYALVPPVQDQVRNMVDTLLDYVVNRNHWNIPAPPDMVVFTSLIGEFDMQLDFLRIGAMVNPPQWGPAFQEYQSASALSWLPVWFDTLDPMNSYFGFNLSHATLSPALFLEQSDSTVRQNLLAAYQIMRRATATHQNPYYDVANILVAQQAERTTIASAPAPSNQNIPLSSEITSLLAEWLERWNLVQAKVVQGTDSPFPTNAIPNPGDIQWLWNPPRHVGVYTGLGGQSCQVLSTFALPIESRPGDRDYLWEDSPFDTGVTCTGPNVGPPPSQTCDDSDPSCRTMATAPYREGAAIDYLLPYWMAVYLGLLK